MPQAIRLELGVENDQVQVRGHDDVGVDAQLLLPVAKGKAVGDDLAGRLRHEDGQPFDDGVGEVVDGGVGIDFVAFHGAKL